MLKSFAKEIFNISYPLFKIMIPVLIIVKCLDEFGFTEYLGQLLSPLMSLVGLPDSMGIVWATTILTNIYTGMVIFSQVDGLENLTVAQVSIIGSMMLLAHGLPLEGAIAKKAGVNVWVTLLTRVGGALVYGWVLKHFYNAGNLLQEPVNLLWQPSQATQSVSIFQWSIDQIHNLLIIQVIIISLVLVLKLLKLMGIEKLISYLLKPILKTLAIAPKCTSIIIIGITLGLSFGGGLLINEAKKGDIDHKSVFMSIVLLGLLHSIIEDTLLILLLGADLYSILLGRMIFAIVVAFVFSKFILKMNNQTFYRFFCKPAS